MVSWPPSLRRVKVLTPRAAIAGLVGLEYLLFVPLYAYVGNWCYETVGEPYRAALAHYQNSTSPAAAVEVVDEWDMPSWQPETHNTFADEVEGEVDGGLPDPLAGLADAEPPVVPRGLDDLAEEAAAAAETVAGDGTAEEAKPDKPLPNPYMPNFWACLAFIAVLLANALVWFVQRWLIAVRAFVQYGAAQELKQGTWAFITPHPHQGAAEIVPVQSMEVQGELILYVTFQRQRFQIDPEKQELKELECGIDQPLATYATSKGHTSLAAVEALTQKFGSNSLHIPMPLFQDIFVKQMLGPVPVFQILCTCLWLMDEYWNYALFNVFSICMFEASTAFGRLKNLQTLRSMKNKVQTVQVLRAGQWSEVSTEELVPGDLFAFKNDGTDGDPNTPCDALLLQGSAVMNEASLTGESTPQMKEAVVADGTAAAEPLDILSAHKSHVLYSGTTLMQHSDPPEEVMKRYNLNGGGCICYCLRTGFASSQGQLVRMIEYSSEQVMSDAKETLALLFILLVFALMASGYVLKKGLEEGKKSQYELVLRCVLILTAVVPPELPMQVGEGDRAQTAVAVNTALLALYKSAVFCTEPFRIPYAGKVEVCLFDKTGTLTTDHLVMVGTVACAGSLSDPTVRPINTIAGTSWPMAVVMGACHALVQVGEKVCGDPIETESVKALGWVYNAKTSTVTPGEKAVPCIDKSATLKILFRWHFSSRLQRMATLGRVTVKGQSETWMLVKGSPEAVGKLLQAKPVAYDATYTRMAQNGMRVLALAYRRLDGAEVEAAASLASTGRGVAREDLEKDLVFGGFVAFSCKVRADTKSVIADLQGGSHMVIMATGDAALTALHVAGEVGITSETDPTRALQLAPVLGGTPGALQWVQMRQCQNTETSTFKGDKVVLPYKAEELPALKAKGFDLCITGDMLDAAADLGPGIWAVCEHVAIYARMKPEHKERVIRALRERGQHTLMCGDGANDVGALKQAHVGVALLSGFGNTNTIKDGEKPLDQLTEAEKAAKLAETQAAHAARRAQSIADRKKDQQELQELQKVWFEEERAKLEAAGDKWAQFKAVKNAMSRMMAEQKRRVEERNKKYGGSNAITASASAMATDMDTGEVPMVKLGDASVAAPFTSKLPSVRSCVDVVRQGRCTLVSTIQMQQILALNCLIAAYSLSALFLDGVRSGENQMIASGMLLTVAGLSFSYARPVKELSPVRPITSIFHPAISLSIAGQLLIHLYCMVNAIQMAKDHSTAEELEEAFNPAPLSPAAQEAAVAAAEEEGGTSLLTPFKPSLLNTVVFLIETAQQVSVMAVNYKGRPFMIASTENRPMLYSLAACCAGTFIAAFEVVPMLNDKLQLVPLPSDEFRIRLLTLLGYSVGGALLWDRVCTAIFARRLVMAGYRDAYKAFMGKENLTWFAKSAYILITITAYAMTENTIILLGAYYFWRQCFPPAVTARPGAAANAAARAPVAAGPSGVAGAAVDGFKTGLKGTTVAGRPGKRA